MRNKGIIGTVTFGTAYEYLADWLKKLNYNNIVRLEAMDSENANFLISSGQCNYENFADDIHIFFTGYLCDDLTEGYSSYTKALYSLYKNNDIQKMLNLIDGSYSLLIFDKSKQVAYIACDRFASQPIYYNIFDRTITFSSHLKDFFKLQTLDKRVNLAAVASMIGSGWVHNNHTYYEDVKFLMSGHYIKVSDGGVQVLKYWDYKIENNHSPIDKIEYKKKLKDLLINAVEKRTRNNNPSLLLSGGTDSRLLLGVMLELGRPVDTYSYAYKEMNGDDCYVAEQTAKKAGVSFNKLIIDEINPYKGILMSASNWAGMRNWVYEYDPLSDLSNYSDNWMGGDESFGWNKGSYINEYDAFNHIGISFMSQQKELRDIINNNDLYNDLLQRDSLIHSELLKRKSDYDLPNAVDYLYTTERLPRNILPCRYIVTQQGCNFINPWLDKDILEFMRQLPYQYRTDKNLLKELAMEMYPKLFSISPAKYGGASRFIKDKYGKKENVRKLFEYSSEFYSSKIDFEQFTNKILNMENDFKSKVSKAKYKLIRQVNNKLGWLPNKIRDGELPITISNQQFVDRIIVMGIICNKDLGLRL
ncbi:asparagine synthase-related protein [Oceanobacillus senegalensis]|uniref:asparagine synthase-related protein n=1 Tax=Oceanobacillus senegalensis TaxID=1936063 RepID=UPI000A304908|nr:asparagine synthase-related protein [Oceanobacillus senegalensis]